MQNNISPNNPGLHSAWRASDNELRKGLVALLAVPLLLAAILLGSATVTLPLFPNIRFLLGLGMLVLSLASLALCDKHGLLAHHLILWGSAGGLLLALWALPEAWLPFLSIPIVFAGLALSEVTGLLCAILFAAMTYWLTVQGVRTYALPQFMSTLGMSFIAGWAILRTLYSALHLAWETEKQTDQMLLEARDRQASLASVLKSLELTTSLLEQANRRLYIAHQQAEEAQRLKEQFAANVSHELRTPLNLILGFSELLYLSPEVYGDMQWPPTLRRDIYQIYRSSRHLLEMVDDILDLSRFELAGFTLNKEPTDIAALIQSTVEITAGLFRDRPVTLDVDIEAGLPMLNIDRTRIRQVILNLLSNARRFTESGHVRVTTQRVGGDVLVSVSDTGPGIPPDKLSRVFEEFYQVDGSLRRTHDGTGLGLAISRHFVEVHDGRIWAESELGKGSVFYFSLPIPDVGAPTLYPKRTPSLAPAWKSQAVRVAVVDPDPSVAALVRRHLDGCAVSEVSDAEQLVEQIDSLQPDVVIQNVTPTTHKPSSEHADTSLADRAQLATIPLIRCSLPSKAWLAQELSVAGSLNKPITAEQLCREIAKLGAVQNILVIDDDRGFSQLVERILTAPPRTYQVQHAYDGNEGLLTLQSIRPDVILLDLIMPNMDGFEFLAHKSRLADFAEIPVILLSVTSAAEDALLRQGNQLTVNRAGGLKMGEVLGCLQALVTVLKPQHMPVTPAPSSQSAAGMSVAAADV
jgi:signal transduction histidine kinase/CheY-like chemotaxis protein